MGGADRDREGIGGIVGSWQLLHVEHQLHHPLDLALVGAAVASDGHLDLVRPIFEHGDAALGGREQDDAARLADGERSHDVAIEEEPLDAQEGRIVRSIQLDYSGVDLEQPLRKGLGG